MCFTALFCILFLVNCGMFAQCEEHVNSLITFNSNTGLRWHFSESCNTRSSELYFYQVSGQVLFRLHSVLLLLRVRGFCHNHTGIYKLSLVERKETAAPAYRRVYRNDSVCPGVQSTVASSGTCISNVPACETWLKWFRGRRNLEPRPRRFAQVGVRRSSRLRVVTLPWCNRAVSYCEPVSMLMVAFSSTLHRFQTELNF